MEYIVKLALVGAIAYLGYQHYKVMETEKYIQSANNQNEAANKHKLDLPLKEQNVRPLNPESRRNGSLSIPRPVSLDPMPLSHSRRKHHHGLLKKLHI